MSLLGTRRTKTYGDEEHDEDTVLQSLHVVSEIEECQGDDESDNTM